MVLKTWQSLPLLAVGTYAVFCLVVVLRQDRLLYFPQRLLPPGRTRRSPSITWSDGRRGRARTTAGS